MSGHSGKLLRHTVLYAPAQFLPSLVQFATTVLWTHLLDPTAFGLAAFVIAAQEIAAVFGLTPWSLFVLRYRARYTAADERFRLMDNRMALCASALQAALALVLLAIIGAPASAALFAATAAYLVTRMLLTHYGEWARADHAIGAYTSGQLIGSFIGAALSIFAILALGPSPGAALAGQAAGQTLALAVLFRQAGLSLRLGSFDPAIWAELRRYGAPIVISGVVGWGAGNIIRLIVQYGDGAVALGLLSVGWGLGQRLSSVLAMLLTAAAYPLAVRRFEAGDREGGLAQVSLNGVLLIGLLAPALVGAALLVRPLVTLLIAENFREVTIVILPIAMLAASIRFLRLHVSDQTMLLTERTELAMKITVVEMLTNSAFCVLGLHLGGLYGAAVGMTVGTVLASIAAFSFCFGPLGLPAPAPSVVLRILLATAVMGAAVRSLPEPATALGLATAVSFGVAVYAAAILLAFRECRVLLTQRLRRGVGAPAL